MSYHKVLTSTNTSSAHLVSYGAIILPLHPKHIKSKDFTKVLSSSLGAKTAQYLSAAAKARQFKGEAGQCLAVDVSPTQSVVLAALPENFMAFDLLGFARAAAGHGFEVKATKILVDLRNAGPNEDELLADVFTAVVGAKRYQPPRYGEGANKSKPYLPKLDILQAQERTDRIKFAASRSANEAEATNLVRYLAELPPNELTCKSYVERCRELAKVRNLQFEFFNYGKLEKLGAGAFLAVAQGSSHRDAGIVALHYKPKSAQRHITFVGKGLVYDTGGVNIKTGNYMFGMHSDMTGSAVALSMILHAATEQWTESVSAYLAIADNAVSNTAYRPNEVITSLSGKTIEIVNTDAEGRMALADTLCLATKEKTDLVMDFATLTGSAVRAIGTRYCAGYSNRNNLRDLIVKSGRESGERVWSFPLDEDFGDCLKSDIADTKQCNLSGGVDHIEAAYFLKKFINHDTPWVHIDLSAAENDGGLGHVETKTTGFGIRFASRFVEKWRSL